MFCKAMPMQPSNLLGVQTQELHLINFSLSRNQGGLVWIRSDPLQSTGGPYGFWGVGFKPLTRTARNVAAHK